LAKPKTLGRNLKSLIKFEDDDMTQDGIELLLNASESKVVESQKQHAGLDDAEALDKLLDDVGQLEDLLGKSVFAASDRGRAENYIISTLGDPENTADTGPLATLDGILSTYSAPLSPSLDAAIRVLRERGFDKSLDFFLLGDVESAFKEANASYSASLRTALDTVGIRI